MAQTAREPVRTRWWPDGGDLLALALLFAIPLAWYGIPAVAGHLLVPGDDQIQNFPLRVLVGQQLRHGILPVYDQYIWSGAPLLGGWNAGALYPFTLLFGVLPSTLSWAVNEMAVYWVAAIGLYAFLRALGRRPVSSALGAASFAFAGAMDVHLSHFGLVAGTSWAPWILLAMVKLARAQTLGTRVRWTTLLAASGALTVLAGEPRAIDSVVIVAVLFFLWTAIRNARPILPFVGYTVLAAFVAVLVGALQWLPGVMSVSTSQRAVSTYDLFSFWSLPPKWLTLALVPGILGGTGSFGTAAWYTGISLPEVMSYVGLLPVVATFGLLGTLRRHGRLPDWVVWHVIAVVGIVLAIGSSTPLGHVLANLPLFGGQRLQGRNIAITDLAFAVLLAYWVDHLVEPSNRDRISPASKAGSWVSGRLSRDKIWALAPTVAALMIAIAAAVSPDTVAKLAGAGAGATQAAAQRPLFMVSAALCILVAMLVLCSTRLSGRWIPRLLVAFVTIDLVFFNLTSVWQVGLGPGSSPSPAVLPAGASPVAIRQPISIGTNGRFVIYDPAQTQWLSVLAIGQPDLNLLTGSFSAQGYSAIVDGPYATATGSHAAAGFGTNALAPSALVDGVFDALDTTTLVTLPEYLLTPVPRGESSVPPTPSTSTGSTSTGSTSTGSTSTGTRSIAAGNDARWVFGEELDVSSVSVSWEPKPAGTGSTTAWRLALKEPDGTLSWQPTTVTRTGDGTLHASLVRPAPAIGLVLQATRPGTFGPPVVSTSSGISFAAFGDLQQVLSGGHWRFEGNKGPLCLFANEDARPSLSIAALPGTHTRMGSVSARSGPRLAPSSAWVSSPKGVLVVRAVAAIPGWSAFWQPSGGHAVALPVERSGVVQTVAVPAGDGLLSWHYSAPGLAAGAWCSLGGLLLLVLMWLWLLFAPRLRARRQMSETARS